MCRVRTRSKREASLQNLTRNTSHMLNIPYNFLNGFELISKMTRGTSQSAEIHRSAEKSHVCIQHQGWTTYPTRDGHTAPGMDNIPHQGWTYTTRDGPTPPGMDIQHQGWTTYPTRDGPTPPGMNNTPPGMNNTPPGMDNIPHGVGRGQQTPLEIHIHHKG